MYQGKKVAGLLLIEVIISKVQSSLGMFVLTVL